MLFTRLCAIFVLCLSATTALAKHTGYAIRDVRVFDGEKVLKNATVVVQGEKITHVVPYGKTIKLPKGLKKVYGWGQTLIPGLIDAHVHVNSRAVLLEKLRTTYQEKLDGGDKSAEATLKTITKLQALGIQANSPDDAAVLFESLAFGVTTLLDQDMRTNTHQYMRSQLGNYLKADLYTSGQWGSVDKKKSDPLTILLPMPPENQDDSTAMAQWRTDLKQWLNDRIAEGSDWTKLYYDTGHTFEVTRVPVPAILLNELGQLVHTTSGGQYRNMFLVHAVSFKETTEALKAGANGLMHLFVNMNPYIQDPLSFNETDYRQHPELWQKDDQVTNVATPAAVQLYDKIIAEFKKTNAFIVPTANAMIGDCHEGNISFDYLAKSNPIRKQIAGQIQLLKDRKVEPYLSDMSKFAISVCYPPNTNRPVSYESVPESIRRFHQAGIPILAGSDAGDQMASVGAGLHRELDVLAYSGLSAIDALKAATSLPAVQFGFNDRGFIKPGMKADLVLVWGNPTKNIRDTRRISKVWKNGTVVDRKCYKQNRNKKLAHCFKF